MIGTIIGAFIGSVIGIGINELIEWKKNKDFKNSIKKEIKEFKKSYLK